ncbi:uncharacterized protein ACLA_072790 [Aspergillus clavatus NRRL 1]|uniref:Uncharacterized protein n=1 Tax=Aspergillus clavatus (strain ATCC 1007 / CBS 513.65 / DSM 816 / NCTC 3887 / NRRL 1 / QM 1276 / 107) TaxID=344612 RepID=A1C775_ASPCL|nr:uncharacterized protein ACLA_072790 [Aspergillus clavatus NRRL 1]EAW14246.1 conserved hypothetical protein [Aspergillus clavatus NRRL 1]
MENTEILVHISAPSGARDDARYRAQVEAILNFQSLSRQLITRASNDEQEGDPALDTLPSESVVRGLAVTPNDESQCKRPLFSVSTGGQFNNGADVQPTVCSQGHAEKFATLCEQSPNDGFRLASPRTKEGTTGPHLEVCRGHELSHSSFLPVPTAVQIGKDSLETPISVIPDSQPELPRTDTESLTRSGSQVHGLLVAVDSPPAKRPCLGLISTLQRPELFTEDSPPVPDQSEQCPKGDDPTDPHTTKSITRTFEEAQSLIPLDSLPLMIKPPPPPISREQFVTHVTPTLTMLTERLKPARTYKPVQQTRDLDPLERGHWYIYINIITAKDCVDDKQVGTWGIALFSRFWSFLSDFISQEGRAGWGVWCIVEDAPEASPLYSTDSRIVPHEKTKSTTLPSSTTHPVILKLYAWGEIVSHMYLLLFLASERRVRRMGAQWRDGEDMVIIQMP